MEPDYWKAYRAAHPEYRKAERERKAAARAAGNRGDRTSEYRARTAKAAALRATETIPATHTGHELFARARKLVPKESTMTTLHDPLSEDLRSEAVLAMLEHRDPEEAVRAYRANENTWNAKTTDLAAWA